eukprot:TRINITY_DN1921_c0_g1_i1.p1 TRINITY_DN1921_c0_g1~~TRINITY_DN1921_c0_g1_i1.p1  ORF type:complete len:196 (+),score=36.05 TRINITY_DN1921_c0_g1_i1:1226-1813(+)
MAHSKMLQKLLQKGRIKVLLVQNRLPWPTVVCVVKTLCDKGKDLLVNLQGLLVTPWHPVKIENTWKFPDDVAPKKLLNCEAVYSFVLDNGHVMLINGIPCVTFGHNLKGDVVEHEYFGTSRVLEDLKLMPGWEMGLVELLPHCTTRDPVTGLVDGLVHRGRGCGRHEENYVCDFHGKLRVSSMLKSCECWDGKHK